MSEDEFVWLREWFQERKNEHIYGDDLRRLNDIKNQSNEDAFKQSELYLQKYNIGDSIEDILYNFYKLYRDKDTKITISQDMKLKVKWQLKFWMESLIWFVENDPTQINSALSSILFILSEKYDQQIELDWNLAKDARNQMKNHNNINTFLKNHANYSNLYWELIKDLSQIDEMNNIEKVFESIDNNRWWYSDEEKNELNGWMYCVWDMGLQYSINKELYSSLESLVLRYQKIEEKIQ